jgi:hypothetical protein
MKRDCCGVLIELNKREDAEEDVKKHLSKYGKNVDNRQERKHRRFRYCGAEKYLLDKFKSKHTNTKKAILMITLTF